MLTASGEAMLARLVPGLVAMNQDLLSRLDEGEDERRAFMRLQRKFVQLNIQQSRAPMRSTATAPGKTSGSE